MMKILIYECNEGLSHYTYCLVNSLRLCANPNDQIIYITPSDNKYLKLINKDIKLNQSLKPYKRRTGDWSIYWILNRLYISIYNIFKRNIIAKREQPDVINIQATMPIIDQYVLPFLKKNHKIILTVHDVIPPIASRNWNMASLGKIYETANHLIVHTKANYNQLIETFHINENKISIIHHGVKEDFDKIDIEKNKDILGIPKNKKVILFFGLIREQKGLDILIEALEGIDCLLIIAGDMPAGNNFDKYKELISKYRINAKLYIEFVSEEFANVLFQISDVIALPYKYFYSQSGVFMQAIQYKKPVIVTDTAGFKDFVNLYHNGIICKPNDVLSLRQAVNDILNTKFSYDATKVLEDNSWAQSAMLHYKLFNKLVKEKRLD